MVLSTEPVTIKFSLYLLQSQVSTSARWACLFLFLFCFFHAKFHSKWSAFAHVNVSNHREDVVSCSDPPPPTTTTRGRKRNLVEFTSKRRGNQAKVSAALAWKFCTARGPLLSHTFSWPSPPTDANMPGFRGLCVFRFSPTFNFQFSKSRLHCQHPKSQNLQNQQKSATLTTTLRCKSSAGAP